MKLMKLQIFTLSLALLTPVSAAFASGSGVPAFRYLERSQSLPPNPNPGDTDTLDVEFTDVDADGDLDLWIIEGTAGPDGRANLLFINDGSGNFTDETAARLPAGPVANSTEIEAADVDGDGDLDAIVANLGPEQLLINDGSGYFSDESFSRLPPPLPLF